MSRLNMTRAHHWLGRLSDLVDCGLTPADAKARRGSFGTSWAQERAQELKRQGIQASVVRVPGEPPVVVYRA